jgi:hypothetical protein
MHGSQPLLPGPHMVAVHLHDNMHLAREPGVMLPQSVDLNVVCLCGLPAWKTTSGHKEDRRTWITLSRRSEPVLYSRQLGCYNQNHVPD